MYRIDGKGSQDEAVSRILLDPADFGDEAILGLERAAVAPGLIEERKALHLSWLLEGALTSFADSLVIPGAVLDAICGVGVLVTIAFYWKDLCRVWDQVVAIFQKYIAGPVEDAFNDLRDRIEGKDDASKYQAKAIKARDAEVARIRALSNTQRDKYVTVAAGYNKRTGQIAVAAKLEEKGMRAYCVEDMVAIKLIALGAKLEDIVMTPSIRPRTMSIIPGTPFA